MLLLYGRGGSNILLSNEGLYRWGGPNPQLGLGIEPLNSGGLGFMDVPAPVRHQGSPGFLLVGAFLGLAGGTCTTGCHQPISLGEGT